jgi:hypothetical protein
MTLRLQIGIGAGLVCLVMIGALAAGAAYTSSQQVSALLNERLVEVAHIMSERLVRYMFTRQRELRLFASLDQNCDIWKSDPGPHPRRSGARATQFLRFGPDRLCGT